MEPHERISRCIFQWEKILLKLCGHNFIDEPLKPNIITYIVYTVVCTGISCEIYSIIFYDMITKVVCATEILLALQVIRFVSYCNHFDFYCSQIQNILYNVYKIYRPSEKCIIFVMLTISCGY